MDQKDRTGKRPLLHIHQPAYSTVKVCTCHISYFLHTLVGAVTLETPLILMHFTTKIWELPPFLQFQQKQ